MNGYDPHLILINTVFALLVITGVIACTINLINCFRASDWLRFRAFTESRMIAVKGSLYTSAIFLLCELCFLFVSGVSIANAPKGPITPSLMSIITSWTLVAAQGLIALGALSSLYMRMKLIRVLDRELEALDEETA